jgi:hypothetical protein
MTHLDPECGCPIEAARREELAGLPKVVIVGAGFGGLTAAKALEKAPAHVTLIDRRNHHLFQPLLYQVATAGLAPTQIATPIRALLRRQRNTDVPPRDHVPVNLTESRGVLLVLLRCARRCLNALPGIRTAPSLAHCSGRATAPNSRRTPASVRQCTGRSTVKGRSHGG